MRRRSARFQEPAYPLGESRFVQIASSHRQHGQRGIKLCCMEAVTIERKKQTDRQKSGAFVAIDKGMVFGQADAISRRQISYIRRFVQRQIERTCEGGFQQTLVAQSAGTMHLA